MKLAALILLSMLTACGGGGGGSNPTPASLTLLAVAVVSGLNAPIFATAPAGDARLFVVERAGRIVIVQGGAIAPVPFLDISARVSTAGEGGLLSMAFDPQYAINGFFYLYF
ncbi:MAG TPA: PQQ-dependent sugar dehydrogenase, partial [Burkholderiales bacterium]|nr:PQQ-dependent sugar dehydrogenase [Burkholderiales bacterium]